MAKIKKTGLLISLCGYTVISCTMLFFLLPVPFGAEAQGCGWRGAAGCAEPSLAAYAMSVLSACAVSPPQLLILGDNQVVDLIITYFWRLLVLCCGIGIVRRYKALRIFFLTLVSASAVLLIVERFLNDRWTGSFSFAFQSDMIFLLVMFIYLAFFKFPGVQKEFK